METKNQTSTELSVVKSQDMAIVATDPRLTQIASRLGFRDSNRLLEQIQKHIPTPLEQQIFVALANDGYGFKPGKFAEILIAHRGDNPLTLKAFERKEMSPNIFFSSIDMLQAFVETIVSLVEEAGSADFKVSIRSAIILAKAYGENAEKVVDGVLDNISEITKFLGTNKRKGPSHPTNLALNFLARKIIPACEEVGIPAPLRMIDFFQEEGYTAARALCRRQGSAISVFVIED